MADLAGLVCAALRAPQWRCEASVMNADLWRVRSRVMGFIPGSVTRSARRLKDDGLVYDLVLAEHPRRVHDLLKILKTGR